MRFLTALFQNLEIKNLFCRSSLEGKCLLHLLHAWPNHHHYYEGWKNDTPPTFSFLLWELPLVRKLLTGSLISLDSANIAGVWDVRCVSLITNCTDLPYLHSKHRKLVYIGERKLSKICLHSELYKKR